MELLIEEGVFARRLLRHSELYKEQTANLVLLVLPLLAMIEHDAVIYINRKWGLALDPEDQKITDIRHHRKFLDGQISYEEVKKRALGTLKDSTRYFNGSRIWRYLGRSKPDVGLAYYQGIPIGSTFSILNNVCGAFSLPKTARDNGGATALGIEMGKSASVLVALADEYRSEEPRRTVPLFDIPANDHYFEEIFNQFGSEMSTDRGAYCFLVDIMTTINLINSLYRGKMLDDLLFIKFITINMQHVFCAIKGLEREVRTSSDGEVYSDNFKKLLSGLIERDDKKKLDRVRPLRNAFIHYDFEKILGDYESKNLRLEVVLDRAVNVCLGIDLNSYINWICLLAEETSRRIADLLKFPRYNPLKNVF